MSENEEFEFRHRLETEQAKQSNLGSTQVEPSFLQTMSNAADRITGTIPAAASVMSPTLGMAQYAGQQMNDASGKLGGAVTELAGRNHVPGLGAAVLGTGAAILSNPMTYVNPGEVASGKFAVPVAPAERQASVSAAKNIGMPLRRGEVTGGRFSMGLSNMMEKSVLGSEPENAFSKSQYAALDAEKQRLTNPVDPYAAGQKAQAQIAQRDASMASTKNAMFDQIPDNVNIPLHKARSVADTIIQEQSQYLPTTRNGDVIAMAKDIQNAETSSGEGVTGGPDKFGETQSTSPETSFGEKSNYQQLKRLREVLGGKGEEAKNSGRYTEARDYQRLKHSIDEDINNYVSGQTSPVGSLVADEFSKSYRKANALSGAYKGLFKSDEIRSLTQASPEKVVDIVFKGKNNESAIKQFRAAAGEKGFLPVKQKFTQDLLDSNNVTKELDKYEEGMLRAIYSGPELEEMRNYGLAQSVPKTTGNLQGTHGSARSNVHGGQWAGLGAGVMSLMHGNIPGAAVGIGQFVAPAGISRLNLATAGGVPYSLGAGSAGAIRGVAGTGEFSNEARSKALAAFIDKFTTRDNP